MAEGPNERGLPKSKKFSAMRSVVRVPSLDPKYKIAILASKQVYIVISVVILSFVYCMEAFFICCRITAWLIYYMDGKMEDSQ